MASIFPAEVIDIFLRSRLIESRTRMRDDLHQCASRLQDMAERGTTAVLDGCQLVQAKSRSHIRLEPILRWL
jgi:hypothetical protein